MIPIVSYRNGEKKIEECENKPETCEFKQEGGHNVLYCTYASRQEAIRCVNDIGLAEANTP